MASSLVLFQDFSIQPPNSKMRIVQTPQPHQLFLFHQPPSSIPRVSPPYSARTTTAAAMTAPTDPATWLAAPVKWVGWGEPVVTEGLVPFVPMLLTIKDGQGVPSDMDGAVRVIILSGAGDGQEVPQGARTVDWNCVSMHFSLHRRSSRKRRYSPER